MLCASYPKLGGHENQAYVEFSLSSLMYRLIVRTQILFIFPLSGRSGVVHRRICCGADGVRNAKMFMLGSWFKFVGICTVTELLRWLDPQGRPRRI